ncbi:unnamed protein product [Urochloa humidicola]
MAPELVDELEDEVLLRIRADDPATLVRTSLACKRWWRLIHDDPDFRRRRLDLHRPPPPLLGFACNLGSVSEFVPSSTTTCCAPAARRRGWRCLDARHGRVLRCGAPLQVGRNPLDAAALVVWDPAADDRRELPKLPPNARADNQSWNTALLCAPCHEPSLDNPRQQQASKEDEAQRSSVWAGVG